MTHGLIPREPRPPMMIVNPGPLVKVYVEGCEVAAVPLTCSAALVIAGQLLTAVSVRLPAATNTPTENLPFTSHMDAVRARGIKPHADSDTYHPQFDGVQP